MQTNAVVKIRTKITLMRILGYFFPPLKCLSVCHSPLWVHAPPLNAKHDSALQGTV